MRKTFLTLVALFATACAFAQENLALGGRASATSGLAALAIDGDTETRWATDWNDNQSWTLDLGEDKTFNTVQIVWENAYSKSFTIAVSNDGKNYSDVLVITDDVLYNVKYYNVQTKNYFFDTQTARYVKFTNVERGTQYGVSFWEFRLFNLDAVGFASMKFETFMTNLILPLFQYGNRPGCVVEEERAHEIADRIEELRDLAASGTLSEEDAVAGLDEAQALVAETNTLHYRPVVPGYYRFVCSMPGFEEKQGVKKAMYSEGNTAKWGTLDENAMNQLWIVEEEDGHLYVRNAATCLYFTYASIDASLLMHEVPTWVEFTRMSSYGDFKLVAENERYPFHCLGHSSGNGESGDIIGFHAASMTASSWNLIPVSEEKIAETWGEDAIDAAQRQHDFTYLLNNAQAAVQEANEYNQHPVCDIQNPVIDRENKIFTTADNDGTHVTSPCSDQTEGNIDNLLDGIEGDANNFWHSDWHETYDGTWCNGYHYLQFNLKAPYQKLALYYVPRVRPASNNNTFEGWPEEFTIYYTNTPDDEESWKRGVSFGEGDIVADLHELRQNYLPFYINEGAQYVRVVCTKGYAWKNGHKFWMAGEMNFCTYEADVIYDEGTDLLAKADLQGAGAATALLAAIEAAEGVSNPTAEQVAALRDAYDAFMAVYTSPAVINNLIVEAKTLLNSVEYGNEPGQKPESAKEGLAAAIATAEAWVVANMRSCILDDYNAAVAALQDAIDAWNEVELNPELDIETAISSVSSANPAVIYNLNGQRVTKAQNGLYIIGGKKVVVR